MAEASLRDERTNPFGLLLTAGGVLLQMLGLSGIADGLVAWRGFFEDGVMRHYSNILEAVTGGPLSPVVSIMVGYLVSCVGFFFAAYQTMREHQRYLRNFTLPRDYESVEHPVPYDERGLDSIETWAHRRSHNAVVRLLALSLVWPIFLLWAIYVWVLRPKRKLSIEMTEAEQNAVRMSGFDYGRAARREAFAFLKWSMLSVVAFLAVLFVSSDILTG